MRQLTLLLDACGMYPADPEFLASVREEVAYQVKRLRDHACLALWCGNNENVGALNWFAECRADRDRYVVDYDRLNEGAVGNTVDALDPTRTFWPSSPCGGRGDYTDCWHDDSRGDMHFWAVWHQGQSFDAYQKVSPRFCSEFGYQSFPSLDSIRGYAPEEQWNVTSPVMEHHQRHGRGNALINEMFGRYFRLPHGFANFVWLSQLQQALAIRTAVEHWRRLRPVCMGALYWQLNDNWPVCSWASVEYGGKWKLLHYFARRFFQPLSVTVQQVDGGPVSLWVASDLQSARPVRCTIRVLDWQGTVLHTEQVDATAPAAASVQLREWAPEELLPRPADGFLVVDYDDGTDCWRNLHFFTEYKRCDLARPEVSCDVREVEGGTEVVLATDRPAFFVTVDARGLRGEFSDNGITLLPGETQVLRFTARDPVDLATFRAALAVSHLRASYE